MRQDKVLLAQIQTLFSQNHLIIKMILIVVSIIIDFTFLKLRFQKKYLLLYYPKNAYFNLINTQNKMAQDSNSTTSTELKRVALHDIHTALGAKLIPFAGYQMPVWYASQTLEHHAVREKVGMFDVSHMGEFSVKGEGAEAFLQYVTSNDVATLYDGRVQYSYLPNDTGGIVDDLLVYRMAENDYFLVVNASNIEKDWNWMMKHKPENVEMTNISDSISLFAVQGAVAIDALQSLTKSDLKQIPYYHFVKDTFAGIPKCNYF